MGKDSFSISRGLRTPVPLLQKRKLFSQVFTYKADSVSYTFEKVTDFLENKGPSVGLKLERFK